MMYQELVEQIFKKRSFLCVGLDIDDRKLPECLVAANPEAELEDLIIHFACDIIDATAPYAVAYKPNLAFYERNGAEGILALNIIIDYIRENYPDILIIADAKRGDIGNTAQQYADAIFDGLDADAVTLNPYMGYDSIAPFLSYEKPDCPKRNLWSVILALTSNKGCFDFQLTEDANGEKLYQKVLRVTSQWEGSSKENTMYVIGATRADMLADVRRIVPEHFLLVPGVGAQGGSLEDVAKYGMTKDCGLLVNSSRGIIYAHNGEDYAEAAGAAAQALQQQMDKLLP